MKLHSLGLSSYLLSGSECCARSKWQETSQSTCRRRTVVTATVAVNNSHKKKTDIHTAKAKRPRKLFFLIKWLSDHVTNLNCDATCIFACANRHTNKTIAKRARTKHQAKSKEVDCKNTNELVEVKKAKAKQFDKIPI